MFKQINPLLKGGATLCITMASAPEDKVRLTITRTLPKDAQPTADSPLTALNQPIVVTGTVDELDVELPDYLAKHVTHTTGVRATFEALQSTLEEERKAAEARIAEQKKRGQSEPKAAAAKPAVSEPALF